MTKKWRREVTDAPKTTPIEFVFEQLAAKKQQQQQPAMIHSSQSFMSASMYVVHICSNCSGPASRLYGCIVSVVKTRGYHMRPLPPTSGELNCGMRRWFGDSSSTGITSSSSIRCRVIHGHGPMDTSSPWLYALAIREMICDRILGHSEK